MQFALIPHVVAGAVAIGAGAGAIYTRKGGKRHRALGSVFSVSMLLMAAIGAYLALFTTPTGRGAAPPQASASVAVLTLYLVATAWMTVRRKPGEIGLPEYASLACGLFIAAALFAFGALASRSASGPQTFAPYFVFCAFAAFAAALDLKMIVSGGVKGSYRIARHLWRMCFALFFATAFFFLGQQKVMPIWMRGSPVLVLVAFAPLGMMAVWLFRIWATRLSLGTGSGAPARRWLRAFAMKARQAPCPS